MTAGIVLAMAGSPVVVPRATACERAMHKRDHRTGVRVSTDRPSYRAGEPILVTIENMLPSEIRAVPGQSCSVVSLQRLEAGQWVTQGSCVADSLAAFVIPARSEIIGVVRRPAKTPGGQGPVVGGPSSPSVFEGGVSTLPRAEPWTPGNPTRELPRVTHGREESLPFSPRLDTDIPPGSYRFEFRFTVEVSSGSARKVHSKQFAVSG